MNPDEHSPLPNEIVSTLREAKTIVCLTGAGISAESGIPTFRDAQTGLWARYKPEALATQGAFRANPQLVWDWYRWRRSLVIKSSPNPGHLALARIEEYLTSRGRGFCLITQNVDGLHQRAGSQNILELHGNIMREKCFQCGVVANRKAPDQGGEIPRCQNCNGLLRPDVVWYGENLPKEILSTAWQAAETCEVFFSIGTSGLVKPASLLPGAAYQNGAAIIEINPLPTPITTLAMYSIRGQSGVVLPEIEKLIWGSQIRNPINK